MRILLNGINGHMGREIVRLAKEGYRGAEIAAGVDPAGRREESIPVSADFAGAETGVDCIVDFSHPSATEDLLAFALRRRLPLVIATTGQTEEQRQKILDASREIPVFFAANFSLGVALLIELAKKAASVMADAEIEIVEVHHDRKLDAPSGTALALAGAIRSVRPDSTLRTGRSGHGKREKNEIGIHSLRMGNIVGIHEVLLSTPTQTITLKHEAHDRALFAEGALTAADFLCGKPAGLYDLSSLLKSNR